MRRLTGREYSLSSFRPLFTLTNALPPFSVPHVASSSAAIGKHSHSASVSRSSAHRGGSDGNSMHDPDTTQFVFNQYGQLSLIVSTTAIDCRNILSGCRDYASAQLLAGVISPPSLCRCPILPLSMVCLRFRYMQSRTRVHRTPTCDYLWLPSLPPR
jgi:hypothetical protein